uniref:Transmembrane and immunoglobulin domain-containing protein 1 n=1 Tax=Sus scrofa TaxID=9823 RepID=A0A8D0U5V1_PIG
MPFPITVFSKNPQTETDFEPNVFYLLDSTVIKCSNSSIIMMVTGKGVSSQKEKRLAKEVSFSELSRSDLNSLKMAWKTSSLMQMCRFLLLVILFLPHKMTSSVLTVNGKTENYILDTELGFEESLKCAVQNHTREEELLWYRGEGRVDLKSGNKINSSSVCVTSISENDNGITFTCKLQKNQSVSISVVLNVTFPPLLSGNDLQTAEEGNDVKLVCNVKSNPQAQMTWYKDGSILNLEKDHHQIQQTSEYLQLSITKVKKSDNGTYSCTAITFTERKTKDFHLIVKDKAVTIPIEPIVAACIVVFLTLCFGLLARRKRIMKMRKLRCHLIRQEFYIRTSLTYEVPSVFIAIIKFIPVKLSEVMKKQFIMHLAVVAMTNLIYLQNTFRKKAVKNEK